MTKVVILGSNFAGLDVALGLRKKDKSLEIVVIDKHNAQYYPSTHKVISGYRDIEDLEIDLQSVYTYHNIEFKKDTIISIDTKKNLVIGKDGKYSYDYLVNTLGSVGNYYNIPGADKYSLPFKTSEDSSVIKEKIINLESKDKYSIVVAGSGLTGIESIFELKTYLKNIAKNADLHIVEVMPTIAPWANPSTQIFLKKIMARDKIIVHEGFQIGRVEKNKIISKSNESIDFDILIWCAGLGVNSVIQNSDFEKDSKGMVVNTELRSTSHPNIFGCGDAVSIPSSPCPKTAQFAVHQAPIVAHNVYAAINGKPLKTFKVYPAPALVSLGKHGSILVYKKLLFKHPRWLFDICKGIIEWHWLKTRG
ncbi:MAG TPA: FAD-dependent oxidoreductase [Alphaproteobacteria bacterium]|nr:FAD-dependent oxidoreductase [Alphaproteobacteria bacterium]